MYNYERNINNNNNNNGLLLKTSTHSSPSSSSSIVIPMYHRNVVPKLKNSISNVSGNSYLSSSSSSNSAKSSSSVSAYSSTVPSSKTTSNSNLVFDYETTTATPLRQKQLNKILNNKQNNFDIISYPYSSSSSSSSSSASSSLLNNQNLFIKETDILDDVLGDEYENLSNNINHQQQQQQQHSLYFNNTLPYSKYKHQQQQKPKFLINNDYFNSIGINSSPKYLQKHEKKTSDEFNKAIIYNYHKNKNKNSSSTLPTRSAAAATKTKTATTNRKSEQLFQQQNPGLNEISNKLFFFNNSNEQPSRTTSNTPSFEMSSHRKRSELSSNNNNNNNNNKFYSLRRILSKKLSNTDLCTRTKEDIKPVLKNTKQQQQKSESTKVLNIMKNVLNRLQKKFTINEQQQQEQQAKSFEITESPLKSLTKMKIAVDKSTQTQIIIDENPVLIVKKTTSASLSSESNSSSSASASLSNYSAKQNNNNNHLVSESQEDILCDLEVASYFDRNNQPTIPNGTLYYSYEYGLLKQQQQQQQQQQNEVLFDNNYVNSNKIKNYYLNNNATGGNYSDFDIMDNEVDSFSDYTLPKPTPRRTKKCILLHEHENYAYSSASLVYGDSRTITTTTIGGGNNSNNSKFNYQSATLNMPTPRKPRKVLSSSTTLKQRDTEVRIISPTSSISSVRQLLFHTGATSSATTTPEIKRINFANNRGQSESRSISSTVSKIPRPNAPPPPPPPIGFIKTETTPSSPTRVIRNMGSFDYLGFENYSYGTESHVINMPSRKKYILKGASLDSNDSNEAMLPKRVFSTKSLVIQTRPVKISCFKRMLQCSKDWFSSLKSPLMPTRKLITLLTYMLSMLIFLACITFIVSFQVHVHDFYKKSINFNNISNNTEQQKSEDKVVVDASTQLINRTVLFCNSPYFSYQMNNLIVLPFSLLLTIIFSFFSKRDTLCIGRCSGRPGIPVSMNPFQKRNRFLNAALFCILANEVFKMLESSVFDSSSKNAKSFNSTSDLFNFVNLNLKNMTYNDVESQFKGDFIGIGLGIKPDFFKQQQQQQQQQQQMNNTTTKSIMIIGPVTMNYLKPRLPPRLDMQASVISESASVENAAHVNLRRFKNAKNRTLNVLSKLSQSINQYNDSYMNNTFENMMNMTPNELLRKTYDFTLRNMPSFNWYVIIERLINFAFIICEVLVIGMRYYPLFGILDKNSVVCTFLATLYIWADLIYNVLITGLCEGLKLTMNFNFIKSLQLFFLNYNNLKNGFEEKYQNDFNKNLLFSSNRILYTSVKSLPHFFCLSFVAIRITVSLIQLSHEKIKDIKLKFRRRSTESDDKKKARCYKNNVDHLNYSQNILNLKRNVFMTVPSTTQQLDNNYIFTFEDRYVNNLLKAHKRNGLTTATTTYNSKKAKLIQWLRKSIWTDDIHFRYSNRVVCTYTVCFTVVYYLTCFLLFYSTLITNLLNLDRFSKASIITSISLTTLVIFIQLMVSLKKFRLHLISLYKGGFEKNKYISSKSSYSNQKLALGSFNYAGYAVTYTCWGYLILFLFLTFIFIQITTIYTLNTLSSSPASSNNTASVLSIVQNTTSTATLFIIIILLPFLFSIFLVNLINKLLSKCLARFCFLQKSSKLFALKNQRLFGFFLYYKFFHDCFMGIASCLIRMIKSLVLGIIFMSRLDYSFMGRSLEKMDNAFMAYVGFLHWESYHTNPILISFCQLLKKLNKQRGDGNSNTNSTLVTNNSSSATLIKNPSGFLFNYKQNNKKRVLNKWHLLRTLAKNPQLVEYRKHKICKHKLVLSCV